MHRTKSFTEAMREKYADAPDDTSLESPGIIKFIVGKRKDTKSEAELGHLRNIVLSNQVISHAGIPASGLKSLCPNVIDLDLSDNHLHCWDDVLMVISQLVQLRYLNLTKNHIKDNEDSLNRWTQHFPQLENLVLNRTFTKWHHVNHLTTLMPNLKELHICANDYSTIERDHLSGLQTIECLRLNDNLISSWTEIWKIKNLPNIRTLVLSGNPLESVYYKSSEESEAKSVCQDILNTLVDSCPTESTYKPEEICQEIICDIITQVHDQSFKPDNTINTNSYDVNIEHSINPSDCDMPMAEEGLQITTECVPSELCTENTASAEEELVPFKKLHTLHISNARLNSWRDLQALSDFPNLGTIRLKGIQLWQNESEENRRKLFVACLPNITNLNGSEVIGDERDKAERHFIQWFQELSESDKPSRYHVLEKKHAGKVAQLANIDLSFGYKEYIDVSIIHESAGVHKSTLHVVQPVGILRNQIAQDLDLPRKSFRMFHNPCGPFHREASTELSELFLDSLPLSRFDITEGDEIHVTQRYKVFDRKTDHKQN